MDKYLVLDLETTTKECYGRVANPFFNKIVAIGLKYYNAYGMNEQDLGRFSGHLGLYTSEFQEGWLNYVDIIVGHNLKFDLLYLWKHEGLQDWFKAGGKVWDTQLVEYILTGQQHKYASLRDIAVNKYSCPEREKQMETYWEQGIDTKDIPKELVLEDVKADVLDTEQIYLQQLEKGKEQRQIELIKTQMNFLLATTEMEYNGMKINMERMEQNKLHLQKYLETKEERLTRVVKNYWR